MILNIMPNVNPCFLLISILYIHKIGLREEDTITWQGYIENLGDCYVRLRDNEDQII